MLSTAALQRCRVRICSGPCGNSDSDQVASCAKGNEGGQIIRSVGENQRETNGLPSPPPALGPIDQQGPAARWLLSAGPDRRLRLPLPPQISAPCPLSYAVITAHPASRCDSRVRARWRLAWAPACSRAPTFPCRNQRRDSDGMIEAPRSKTARPFNGQGRRDPQTASHCQSSPSLARGTPSTRRPPAPIGTCARPAASRPRLCRGSRPFRRGPKFSAPVSVRPAPTAPQPAPTAPQPAQPPGRGSGP